MHSRIYNLSQQETLEEDYVFDRLIRHNGSADYIVKQKDNDIQEDVDWLCNVYDLKKDGRKVTITKNFAQEFWDKRFNHVKDVIDEKGINFDTRFEIVDTLHPTYGMYISHEDYGLIPFEELLHSLAKFGEEDELTFEVTETFDYHW